MACAERCGTGFDEVERMRESFDPAGCLETTAPSCKMAQVFHLIGRDRLTEAVASLQCGCPGIESRFGPEGQLFVTELIDVQHHSHRQIEGCDRCQFLSEGIGLPIHQSPEIRCDIQGISAFSGSPLSLGLL